jgi:methyl coenzyme M reductase alpha subunit
MKKLKQLSWKQKNKLLLVSGLILLWIVYSFAIRLTIDARHQCIVLEQQLDSAADAPARLIHLKKEFRRLENITNTNDTSNTLHERLLSIVTNYCQQNNITLRDFASPVIYHQQEWLVETHPIIVEGAYIDLLKLVHKLEQEKTGKLVSVDFHSKRDNKTQALSLTATIYVQNIIHERS